MEDQQKKITDKHIRKVKACIKRLQANSDNLAELLDADELEELAKGLAMWDKYISTKINK